MPRITRAHAFLRTRRAWPLALAGGFFLFTGEGLTFAPVGVMESVESEGSSTDPTPTWDLASDYRISPDQQNPSEDLCGNPDVWAYMESTTLVRNPATYSPLLQFIADYPNNLNLPGLAVWTNGLNTPHASYNATGSNVVSTGIPVPKDIAYGHPGLATLLAIRWRSPTSDTVQVSGFVSDLDGNCGDGILWFIDKGATNLASGGFGDGGSQDFSAGTGAMNLLSISVSEGEDLYLVIHPNGDHVCDTTWIEFSIYSNSGSCAPATTPTVTPTPTNTDTSTSTPTNTPSSTPTDTPTNTPTATWTSTPTTTPTATNTPPPPPLDVSIADPLGCTGNGDVVDVRVVVSNNGGALFGVTVESSLPAGLTGVDGSCTVAAGSCVVSPGDMTWTGDIPAVSTLTIDYQVQVGAGVATGTQLCIDTAFDAGDLGMHSITECTTVDCPAAPTGVDLRFVRGIGLADHALLVWQTASEAGTLGFNVYRATALAGPWQPVNRVLVAGRGAAASGADYVLRDAPGTGTFLYRLEEVDSGGKRSQLATTEVRIGPSADGEQVFMPGAATWRSEGPAGYRAGGTEPAAAPLAPAGGRSTPPTPSDPGWLARLWRWLVE